MMTESNDNDDIDFQKASEPELVLKIRRNIGYVQQQLEFPAKPGLAASVPPVHQ